MSNAQKIQKPSEAHILASALTNKGVDHYEAQQFDQAIEYFNKALALDPSIAVAYYNLGMLYKDIARRDLMAQYFGKAVEIGADDINLLNNVAASLVFENEFVAAIKIMQEALERFPDSEQSWIILADAYYHIGNTDVTRKIYSDLTVKFPQSITAKVLDAFFIPQIPQSNEEIDQCRAEMFAKMDRIEKSGLRVEKLEDIIPHTLFYLMYQGRPHKEIAVRIAQFFEKICPPLLYTAPHCKKPRKAPGEKLKIGFVTPTMHRPTLNQFMLGVMEQFHTDADFELVVFSNAPYNHPETLKARSKIGKYLFLPKSLQQSQQIIANEEVDILFYLEVGTETLMNCLPHARLAPMQCVWGGCAVTTGIPNMDYYISAQDAEPENAQDHYSEKLIMLSRTLANFSRPTIYKPVRTKRQLRLPEGDMRLYTCPVTLFKLHPDMDVAFTKILERDPKSVILLFDPMVRLHQVALRKRFAKSIPADLQQRIIFLPYMSSEDFLEMLCAVDCVLDTFHLSFGTTAWLSISAGAPFVTWEGPTMCGRTASRMFRQIDVPELITYTHDEFVERAVKLANDKEFYKDMAEKIDTRSHVFFNDTNITDEFKTKLKQLYFASLL